MYHSLGTSDSILFDKNAEKHSIQYHYVISQWFVEIVDGAVHGKITTSDPEFSRLNAGVATSMTPPTLVAVDGAADAK